MRRIIHKSLRKATPTLMKIAIAMGENYTAMNRTHDEEARDFYRGEYELHRQKYEAELARITMIAQSGE